MPLHKVTCVPRGHALGVVRTDGDPSGLKNYADSCIFQTSQLPEDDRYSVTQTEFKATIDVCMGGRVAEGLSEFFSP
jgi:ATP-dependent metalloprotease